MKLIKSADLAGFLCMRSTNQSRSWRDAGADERGQRWHRVTNLASVGRVEELMTCRTDNQPVQIRRAIISVSNKKGVVSLGQRLAALGVEILSTGGTRKVLEQAGIPTLAISTYTGAPEILDGRVKTLHPKIHGGLLGRPTAEHIAQMEQEEIGAIDLAVVNLYPFEETIAKEGVSLDTAIEHIDIGGPSMLRSAAKNFERVAVVVDPDDYETIASELEMNNGALDRARRFSLCRKAFAHTAAYDAAIAAYLSSRDHDDADTGNYPEVLSLQWSKKLELRYGENPHQTAAFYQTEFSPLAAGRGRPSLANATVLQGKALSYNNLLDLDAALSVCLEFERPTAVVVKHTNPCGAACSDQGVATAYRLALQCDPMSAFGGIVAVNREIDADLAEQLVETFLECVIAPSYSAAAREILARKKNLRLTELLSERSWQSHSQSTDTTLRSVLGGVLVQSADLGVIAAQDAKLVTERGPSKDEMAALDFAWKVAKHVKSNAILFCHLDRTAAVGAGQMSRVDAAKVAQLKAQLDLGGSVVASDAFFPFRDGIDTLATAGATAVIQPGGSIRDAEVIAAANEHNMAMLFTGMRHFRH